MAELDECSIRRCALLHLQSTHSERHGMDWTDSPAKRASATLRGSPAEHRGANGARKKQPRKTSRRLSLSLSRKRRLADGWTG